MAGSLYENLRQLITLVDELRDVGLQHYISLPRIAAIGTQSSGKSSLIESVVGLDFLPRGGGVVTRRPLELRLVHLNSQDHAEGTAWAIFESLGDKKITDFNKVREEIERQTDMVAGSNKGIVNDPIILTIYATGAPDLTLIDLPGVTRVPVKGSDQVEDIEKVTRDMTMHYIQDQRTIVLCVIPANQDMSVSDALQLSRNVDPNGHRSIGVITKIDIMDQGTDACKMLRGEDIPLKHGYVGVKMRSQQDITSNKPVKQALQEEKAWFESHRVYGKMPPGFVGTTVLIDKLTGILFKHIRKFLPEIKKEINEKRRSVQDRLDELGSGAPVDETERIHVMWTMITDYCEMLKNTIRGKYDRRLQRYIVNLPGGKDDASMSGGSKIRDIMNDFMVEYVDETITKGITDEEIDRSIRMHEGDSLPGFPSPDAFEFLALPHLQKISIPSTECVHNVASALDVLAQRLSQAVFRRFPKLAECALEMTQNIIAREKENTRVIVEQQVASITGYLFTNDQDYLTAHGSMESVVEAGKPPPQGQVEERRESSLGEKFKDSSKSAYQAVSSGIADLRGQNQKQRESRYSGPFVNEIRKRLDSYFSVTVRSVRDMIPKAVGYYLVRAVQEKIQFELLQSLQSSIKMQELLGEPPHIVEERRTLQKQLDILKKASQVLTRDPTLASIAFEAEFEEEEEQPRKAPAAPAAAASKPMVAAGGLQKTPAAGASRPAVGAVGGPSAAGLAASTGAMVSNAAASAQRMGQTAVTSATTAVVSAGVSAAMRDPGATAGLFGSVVSGSKPSLFDEEPKTKGANLKNPLFGD
eukprot:TRINITY_DN45034_c0_g1_i1.p1 TRINITY_DN45034_c0_g1~~TRINITY_DN45034_c0_g1_i1.p1  ORF type:complete len:813 (+),score=173.26 TRINITY_DN45034_c0_g1_i1:55-2493(+)